MPVPTHIVAKRVEHWKDVVEPGQYILTTMYSDPTKQFAGMVFMCPCGCGEKGSLAFDVPVRTEREKQMWQWNGDVDKPTLTPSIQKTTGCMWHGFLKEGIFTNA